MNYITQCNRLEKQKLDFIKFMKICPENSVLKLAQEITKIETRIETIRTLKLDKLTEEVSFQYETKQSVLNKKSFDKKTDLITRIIEREFLTT